MPTFAGPECKGPSGIPPHLHTLTGDPDARAVVLLLGLPVFERCEIKRHARSFSIFGRSWQSSKRSPCCPMNLHYFWEPSGFWLALAGSLPCSSLLVGRVQPQLGQLQARLQSQRASFLILSPFVRYLPRWRHPRLSSWRRYVDGSRTHFRCSNLRCECTGFGHSTRL